MKKLFLFVLTLIVSNTYAQDTVLGKWKTIDDQTGKARSIVEIYKRDNKVYGKIISIFPAKGEPSDPICIKCSDDDPRKNQKIIGMEILKNMEKDDNEYAGGEILKPDEGKVYRCKIWASEGKLYVRGYIGFMYRTQEWLSIK